MVELVVDNIDENGVGLRRVRKRCRTPTGSLLHRRTVACTIMLHRWLNPVISFHEMIDNLKNHMHLFFSFSFLQEIIEETDVSNVLLHIVNIDLSCAGQQYIMHNHEKH